MRAVPTAAHRRTVMAGLLLLAAAAFGACERGSPVAPPGLDPAASSSGGSTQDSVPGDSTHVPRDSTAGPDDSAAHGVLIIHVASAVDSVGAPVAGAVVTVSRGAHVEATFTSTASGAPMALSLTPGMYTVRLTTLPAGWSLAPGSSDTIEVRVERNAIVAVRFRLTR